VHNANCLGAALLARVFSLNQNKKLIDYSKNAFDFTISCQNDNGSWAYKLDPRTGKIRKQVDFHQGFVVETLCDFIKHSGKNDSRYEESMLKGASFYKNKQFLTNGQAKWRLPQRYPVDIHHIAQGIITFTKVFEQTKSEKFHNFSEKIFKWAIQKMLDENGYFYYQKWPFLLNKIEYFRWNQAWMFYSISNLI
jgi:rhamnogalacturonyl hydrolase YesR